MRRLRRAKWRAGECDWPGGVTCLSRSGPLVVIRALANSEQMWTVAYSRYSRKSGEEWTQRYYTVK